MIALRFGAVAARLALAAGLGLLPATASAAALPDGGVSAQEMAQVLRAKGYQTEILAGDDGEPKIRSSAGDTRFVVYLFGCQKRTRCASIQFASGFQAERIAPARIAEWNATKRFGRASQDEDGDPWLEMDVELAHGGSTELLAANLERWESVLGAYGRWVGK